MALLKSNTFNSSSQDSTKGFSPAAEKMKGVTVVIQTPDGNQQQVDNVPVRFANRASDIVLIKPILKQLELRGYDVDGKLKQLNPFSMIDEDKPSWLGLYDSSD